MTTQLIRLEFDETLDDLVDVDIRLARQTKAYRRSKRRTQSAFALSLAVALFVVSGAPRKSVTPTDWIVGVGFAAGIGVISWWLYGRFHDRCIRIQHQRMINEMYGGVSQLRCIVELLPDKVWIKQNEVELAFPWRQATKITSNAVELWFNQGLVVLRDHVFVDADHRRVVLERARELAAKAA